MEKIANFTFCKTLEYASYVRAAVFQPDEYNYLNNITDYIETYIKEAELLKCIKPDKYSLLHSYIKYSIDQDMSYTCEKDLPVFLDEYRKLFISYGYKDAYGIDISNFGECIEWDDIYDNTNNIWENIIMPMIVDEVFTVLFSDREFLLKFNFEISKKISTLKKIDYEKYLKCDGILKRYKKFPSWAEKAVFYRDKGHCALCLRDLTNSFLSSRKYHIDHIIPLSMHGTNDITNLQILCDKCNLKKKSNISTSNKYFKYY